MALHPKQIIYWSYIISQKKKEGYINKPYAMHMRIENNVIWICSLKINEINYVCI